MRDSGSIKSRRSHKGGPVLRYELGTLIQKSFYFLSDHAVVSTGDEGKTQGVLQCVRSRALRDSIELCLARSRCSC